MVVVAQFVGQANIKKANATMKQALYSGLIITFLVTIIIIAANVIISYKGFSDYSFFDKYKFQVGGVRRGEQIRMVSSGFLHADTQHLLFNMLSLYFFADVVITLLSPIQFLFVYFGSLLVGSLLSLYFHKNEYLK